MIQLMEGSYRYYPVSFVQSTSIIAFLVIDFEINFCGIKIENLWWTDVFIIGIEPYFIESDQAEQELGKSYFIT